MEKALPGRRSLRLAGYDYSRPGAYFVTICMDGRQCVLGSVTDAGLLLSPMGQVVRGAWEDLPNHYQGIELDEFVVMPNHVHGVVVLRGQVGAGFKPAPTENQRHSLSEVVRAFKTFSARGINELRGTPGLAVWQRNYYERVVRDEEELNRIREYIQTNPFNWHLDRENPDREGQEGPDTHLFGFVECRATRWVARIGTNRKASHRLAPSKPPKGC
jgi:REP element-mobilizing transposase RayT